MDYKNYSIASREYNSACRQIDEDYFPATNLRIIRKILTACPQLADEINARDIARAKRLQALVNEWEKGQ